RRFDGKPEATKRLRIVFQVDGLELQPWTNTMGSGGAACAAAGAGPPTRSVTPATTAVATAITNPLRVLLPIAVLRARHSAGEMVARRGPVPQASGRARRFPPPVGRPPPSDAALASTRRDHRHQV